VLICAGFQCHSRNKTPPRNDRSGTGIPHETNSGFPGYPALRSTMEISMSNQNQNPGQQNQNPGQKPGQQQGGGQKPGQQQQDPNRQGQTPNPGQKADR
jgi:hypothetical protein